MRSERPTSPSLTIYPEYCHRLSPTINKWCPLASPDLQALTRVNEYQGQNILFHLNHPIKWVKIVGVVVAIDEIRDRIVYTIDDSSGQTTQASCTAPPRATELPPDPSRFGPPRPAPPVAAPRLVSPDSPRLDLTDIDVGAVVKIKGGLGVLFEHVVVRMKAISLVQDTNAEVKCWEEVRAFRREVLSWPWEVTEVEERGCRAAVDSEARIAKEVERRAAKKARLMREKEKGATSEGGSVVVGEVRWDEGKAVARGRVDALGRPKVEQKTSKSRRAVPQDLSSENTRKLLAGAARMRADDEYDALGL